MLPLLSPFPLPLPLPFAIAIAIAIAISHNLLIVAFLLFSFAIVFIICAVFFSLTIVDIDVVVIVVIIIIVVVFVVMLPTCALTASVLLWLTCVFSSVKAMQRIPFTFSVQQYHASRCRTFYPTKVKMIPINTFVVLMGMPSYVEMI